MVKRLIQIWMVFMAVFLAGCGNENTLPYPEQVEDSEHAILSFDLAEKTELFKQIYTPDVFDSKNSHLLSFIRHVNSWEAEDCLLIPPEEIADLMADFKLEDLERISEKTLQMFIEFEMKSEFYEAICRWKESFTFDPPNVEFAPKPFALVESLLENSGYCPIKYAVYRTNWGRKVVFNDCVTLWHLEHLVKGGNIPVSDSEGEEKKVFLQNHTTLMSLAGKAPFFNDPYIDELIMLDSFLKSAYREDVGELHPSRWNTIYLYDPMH